MRGTRTPFLDSPPLQRYGLPEYVRRPNPAVATAFTEPLGGDYFVRLLTMFCRIVADGNAANRDVSLEYLDNSGNVYATYASGTAVTAGQTRDMYWSVWQSSIATVGTATHLMPLGALLLPPTHTIRVNVSNVQVGDQLSRIAFNWERFYTKGAPGNYGPDGPQG